MHVKLKGTKLRSGRACFNFLNLVVPRLSSGAAVSVVVTCFGGVAGQMGSQFVQVKEAAPIEVFLLSEECRADTDEHKVNLTVGGRNGSLFV